MPIFPQWKAVGLSFITFLNPGIVAPGFVRIKWCSNFPSAKDPNQGPMNEELKERVKTNNMSKEISQVHYREERREVTGIDNIGRHDPDYGRR
jgi:hypothetical protein